MSKPTVDLSSVKDKVSKKMAKADEKRKTSEKEAKKVEKSEKNEVLRKEALALGASEKDIELVENLSDHSDDEKSEQEFGADDDEDDSNVKEEIQSFMKKIGLDKNVVNDISSDEEEPAKLVEGEDDVEDSLSSDSIEEEQEQEEDDENQESEIEQETEENLNKDSGFISDTTLVTSDKLVVPTDTVWYEIKVDLQYEQNLGYEKTELTSDQITKLYERGKKVLMDDNQTYYDEFTRNSSQKKFMSQVLSDGTLNDKISALTLLIQESPLHNVKSIDTLVGYCNKKSRNSVLQSLNALKDLLLNNLLPSDRKLRFFKNQPGLSMMLNKRTLALFYFEDYLKKTFFKILETLEKISHDPIIHVRSQVLTHIFDFITSKPEQEFNLLRLGVNKLGDIDSKVSSKTSFLLLKLQQAHPNMKNIIIDAIVDIALKPNADYHTTYYSVITLNQTILKRSEDDVANTLIKTYFTLFEKFLIKTDKDNVEGRDTEIKSDAKGYEKKRKKNFKRGKNGGKSVKLEKSEEEVVEEKNSKLFSALLTGVNRSFPFSKLPATVYEPHLDVLFKITHSTNFNTSIQALVLINQITVKANLNADRYYRTLYESLLDPRVINSSKQSIYLNLLYKSLKQDSENIPRVEAFIKRIFQICLHWLNIGTVAGFLYLLLQLQKVYPQVRNLLLNTPVDHEYQSDDEGDEKNEKVKVYDSRKRDPRFANADKSSLWEISQLLNHYHPTVQKYSESFVTGESDDLTKPDLGLFTITHFLDRFVYRNSKAKATTKGASIMQPLHIGSLIQSNMIVKSSDIIKSAKPVNTENWLNMKVDEIKPDEKFFYQYFTSKKSAIRKKSASKASNDSDSELDEDDVWDALIKSKPDVDNDGNASDGFSSFDEGEFSSMSSDEDEPELDLNAGGQDSNSDAEDEEAAEEAEFDESLFEKELETEMQDSDSDANDDEFFSFIDEGKEDEIESAEESDDESAKTSSKRKRSKTEDEDGKQKKKKKNSIKSLPLFASADDYAQYLQSDEE